MAVRSIMVRDNCWLIHVQRILNKTPFNQKTNVKNIHCCRTHLRSRCLNEHHFKRVVSVLIPLRHLVQDAADERIPNLPQDLAANEKAKTEIVQTEEEEIAIDYYKGLPRITVPLPSRKEKCRFTLKPISNTVRDLVDMIREEDRGIDRVVLHTKDNVKIASSCSIELLLEEEEFYISINDKRHRVRIPPEIMKKSFTKGDIEKLADVRMLISQLYESLNVNEFHAHKERELLVQLEKIQSSLKPLEDQRTRLEKRVALRTSIMTWVGLGLMSVQFGVLARLTWWEYSWDIMEPVTYFVTYGTSMAIYAYFALTKQDYILPEIRDRQYLLTLHKKAHRSGFDLNQYNTLKEQLASVQSDLERLRDPLVPPQHTLKYSNVESVRTNQTTDDFGQNLLDNVRTYFTILINKAKKS